MGFGRDVRMNSAQRAAALLAERLEVATAAFGQRVSLDPQAVLDRSEDIALGQPGPVSPNGHCRMLVAVDGWIALNLARPSDVELVPAWISAETRDDPWRAACVHAAVTPVAQLIEMGALLGLPVAGVGEVRDGSLSPALVTMGAGGRMKPVPQVIDLSSLWAGPLCGAILAAMGAQVMRIEDQARPDPTRVTTPGHFARLNQGKAELRVPFGTEAGRTRLWAMACDADIIITNARPRAFASLGLEPARLFAANPRLIWVAITGQGWTGERAGRVAFGDDAAAAGGLVRWVEDAPHFLGDALADPLTGMAAAFATIEAMHAGGGVLVDAAMAPVAAGAARMGS